MPLQIEKKSSKKTPHLAICHADQGGSANNRHVSLLMKSGEQIELTEQLIKSIEKLGLDNFPVEIQKAMKAKDKSRILDRIIMEEFGEESNKENDWCGCYTWCCDYDDQFAYFCKKGEMYRVTYTEDGANIELGEFAEPVIEVTDYVLIDDEIELSESAKEKIEEGMLQLVMKSFNNPKFKAEAILLVSQLEKSNLESSEAKKNASENNVINKSNSENILDKEELLKSADVQELIKSLVATQVAEQVKEREDVLKAREAEAEEILKAAEAQRKIEFTDVVKASGFVAEDKSEALVEMLMKSRGQEEHQLVLDLLKSAQEKIAELQQEVVKTKEQFATSEIGKDGTVTVTSEVNPEDIIKAKAEAWKARQAQNK